VDDLMRTTDDKPTIGLLLVKEKNHLIAEYCLQGYTQPMGISEWQNNIHKSLPPEFKSSLPSIEELESELNNDQA